MYTVHSTLSGR